MAHPSRRLSLIAALLALAFPPVRLTPQMAQTAQAPAPDMAAYQFRSIGPASAGGRITDVRALESDPRFALVATAGGGVWKTDSMGTTWTPIFDHYGTSSIGAVAVFQPNPQILWVGTGEANNRNSVAWGDGVYKSSDGGATFENMGLRDSFQIARVVTHPTDPNTVYVAAIGNLWASTGERGVFKTTDGGRSWIHLTQGLPAEASSGATDLILDPAHPDTLYAAFYQRLRRPWRFDSGGPDGGIFKTTDAGAHWTKLAGGLPPGPTGRIGLDLYRKNPNVVMAIVEAPGAATGIYRSDDAGLSWRHTNPYNNRPFYYSQIRINPSNDQIVYVLSTSFQESRDGGATFHAMRAPFGPNYDYHAMWLDPARPDFFYLGGDKGLWLTHDQGASFQLFDNLPVEQFYKVATDMRDPYRIYGGLQDNGAIGTVSFSRDVLGIRNDSTWKMHWDDGQYVAVDPTNWRTVYSEGTEGTFRVIDPVGHTDSPRRATAATITNFQVTKGDPIRLNWTTPFILSPHDPERLYYGTNYLLTSTDQGRHWQIISPDLSRNDPAKNQIGTGGITPDTTGAESYATIYTISESPVQKGLIWIGTDDGKVWITRDAGAHWSDRSAALPVSKGLWVSRIVASAQNPGTAYVALDGHRSDDRASYLFKTTDGGRTFVNLSAGLLPNDPVYVILEDEKNPNLLFVGAERGLQASFDAGQSWRPLTANGLPTAPVYDAIIQPRDRDLILATHGRGIYILDDITALEQWKPTLASTGAHLFLQRPATLWIDKSRSGQLGSNTYAGGNPPGVRPSNFQQRDREHLVDTPVITFSLGAEAAGTASLAITSPGGETRTVEIPARPGIIRYVWDGRMTAPPAGRGGRGGRGGPPPAPLAPGVYGLKLSLNGATDSGSLTLRQDPSATDGMPAARNHP